MNVKNFVLSYYKNSTEKFHIKKHVRVTEARIPHTHEYFQIYFISGGSMLHYVEEESAQLLKGDMFIIPPGTVHYIKPDPDTVFYSISFMEDIFSGQQSGAELAGNFLRSLKTTENKNVKPKITISAGEIFYIEGIMKHILKEFTEKPIAYYDTIQAYTTLIVTMLAREYFTKMPPRISDHFEDNKQFVLYCVKYIEVNYADKITLDEISRKSAMSKSSFCEHFVRIAGCSFNRYLNTCRVRAAAEYIEKGYKITSIYGLCGYNDFSTFSRNFSKIMGMTPTEYKNSSRIREL